MGRSEVSVRVGEHHPVERELSIQVHLWSGITANERMDWLLEKATELGAATLLPITAERSVLKLKGERADKKLAHWQAIAVASSEQCGRNRVLQVGQARTLEQALEQLSGAQAPSQAARWVLSLSPGTRLLHEMIQTIRSTHDHDATQPTEIIVLSGPEGGLSPAEEAQAIAAGFVPVSLGNRVLRAETAPVAVLSAIACLE
jgi:16S rRNA (uracil1498-N3)-methyltransferase